MGQRWQSVFILPPVDMGCMDFNDTKQNPNNRSEKVLVFHNQWLYGRGALNINLAIMERLKEAIKNKADCGEYAKTKQGFINHFLEKSVLKAVDWVSIQDLHSETNFHEPESLIYSEEEKKPKKEQTSLSEMLKNQDNNNGFFICSIDSNLNISYAFISGLENTEEHEHKTPKDYLKLFYTDEGLKKEQKGLFEAMQKQIKKFDKFDKIPESNIKQIIEGMNN